MSDLAALPPHVRTYLRRYVLRRRRLAVVRGAGASACVFLGALLVGCLADRFVHFRPSVRWGLLISAGLVSLFILLRPLLRLSRPEVDWLAVADRIEEQNPSFGQRLLTVASQMLGDSGYRGSDEMLGQLAHQLDHDAAGQRPSRLLPTRAVAGPWMLLVLFSASTVALGRVPELNLPQLALRFLAPWLPLPAVTTTNLMVSPGDQNVRQGTAVRIEAKIDRLGGAPVWLYLSETGQFGYRQVPMTIADDPTSAPASTTRPLRFAYTIGSVDRDLTYYVAAGDAVSPHGHLRVLRKPAVAEFRLRYVFPAYTGRPPMIQARTDGRIEAPVGTEVQVTLVATEPLQVAMLAYAGEKQLLTRPPDQTDERVRVGKLIVSKEGKIDIDLISTRDQAGIGPPTAEVKPLFDRPPIARLAGVGQLIRMSPREVLPISYDAIDDYGVDSVILRAQSGSASVELPIHPRPSSSEPIVDSGWDDPRRREGIVNLDLATLPLSPGDLVAITLQVKDSAGATAYSEPLQILISPKPLSVEAFERTLELESAALLAASASEDLESAAKTLVESSGPAEREPAKARIAVASGRSSRRLSASAGASVMARRALIRAMSREPSQALSGVLIAWIDAAQYQASVSEGLFREAVGDIRSGEGKASPDSPVRSRPSRPMLRDADQELAEFAGRLRDELRTAARAERAALLLIDIETLRAAEKRGPVPPNDKAALDRLRLSTQRLRDEIGSGLKSLGLMDRPSFSSEQARDQSRKLKEVVDLGQRLYQSKSKLDPLPAVREWAQRIQRNAWQPITLDERLLAVAQAEAIRPGGNACTARDYHLAGRAAAAIEARADRSRPVPVPPELAEQFVSAYIAIRKEEELLREPKSRDDEAAGAIREAAQLARKQMTEWAEVDASAIARSTAATGPATGLSTASIASTGGGRLAKIEAIALQASADAANRDYPAAAVADIKLSGQAGQTADLANGSTARKSISQARKATEAARSIDQLAAEQTAFAKQLDGESTLNQAQAAKLASTQTAIADRIATAAGQLAPVGPLMMATPDGSARDRAAAAFTGVQSRLGLVPRQLADLLEADADHRAAVEKVNETKRQLREAPADQKPAALRMAEIAAREEAESAGRLAERSATLSPTVGQTMLAALDPFVTDAASARDVLSNRFVPALRTLAESIHNEGGQEQAERAAGDVRKSLESAQIALAVAQADLADRDPLTGAKWYARASAEALSRTPPDSATAAKYQAESQVSLQKAWERSLRYASAQRMSAARSIRPLSFQSIASTQSVPESTLAIPGGLRIPSLGTLAGEWRRLRQRDGDDGNGMLRDVEPAGYEAALKAYFEAIGKK